MSTPLTPLRAEATCFQIPFILKNLKSLLVISFVVKRSFFMKKFDAKIKYALTHSRSTIVYLGPRDKQKFYIELIWFEKDWKSNRHTSSYIYIYLLTFSNIYSINMYHRQAFQRRKEWKKNILAQKITKFTYMFIFAFLF